MKATKKKGGAASSHAQRLSLSVNVRVIAPSERERFDRLLREKHYLGEADRVGDFLRQVVERDGQWVALLVWGPAALKLKDREAWIGWNSAMAAERLKLVVQNRRYLLLVERGQEPNLASAVLAASCRVLPTQWREHFGYEPLIAESFTDPEAYNGTCYKASGWEPAGMSAGNSRARPEFYVPNGKPKCLWLRELRPGCGLLHFLLSRAVRCMTSIRNTLFNTRGSPSGHLRWWGVGHLGATVRIWIPHAPRLWILFSCSGGNSVVGDFDISKRTFL